MAEFLKNALMRRREVEMVTAQSRSTLYEKIKAGRFPEPVKISANSVRWRREDVLAYLASPADYRRPEVAE